MMPPDKQLQEDLFIALLTLLTLFVICLAI